MTCSIKRFLVIVAATLFSSCQQQVQTFTLEEAREYLDMVDNTMSRGIDYLGSENGFHYFEIKREFAPDPRFRISRSSALYEPSETYPYRRWFPVRTPACGELKGLRLEILDEPAGFLYLLGGQSYTAPADIPAHQWQHVRCVYLGHKSLDISSRMHKTIAPYLQGRTDIRYSGPTSGLPAD